MTALAIRKRGALFATKTSELAMPTWFERFAFECLRARVGDETAFRLRRAGLA